MKRFAVFIGMLSAFMPFSFAQTATDPNEGGRLTRDASTGAFTVSWWGRAGRTYTIQHSEDLAHWYYVPIIEVGSDQIIEWGFTSTADRMFLRLKYTDSPEGDPFNVDIDGNGLPDNWELDYFGAFAQDPSADPDNDGWSNLTEYLAGTDPNASNGEVGPQFVTTGLRVFTPFE